MHLKNNVTISICIPAYEMGGVGPDFLRRSLASIQTQSFTDYEIIVSDHCAGDEIKNICSGFDRVRHLAFSEKKGNSSANLNNALNYAAGKFIKIIFQDDFLAADDSLERMIGEVGDRRWLAHGYWHTDYDATLRFRPTNPSIPHDHKQLLKSNSIGAPTAIMFQNCDLRFDENLLWTMDMEFYYRILGRLGLPAIIKDPLAVQTLWPGQLTNQLSDEIKKWEYGYIKSKHGFN
jgi:glycosyltransferase involved in cell wall biosynthesis